MIRWWCLIRKCAHCKQSWRCLIYNKNLENNNNCFINIFVPPLIVRKKTRLKPVCWFIRKICNHQQKFSLIFFTTGKCIQLQQVRQHLNCARFAKSSGDTTYTSSCPATSATNSASALLGRSTVSGKDDERMMNTPLT